MKIGVNDVEWLVDELEERLEAGYMWSVYECWGDDEEFQHVHFFYDRDNALDYCASAQGNYPVIRLEETAILRQLMENIYNSDKDRNDIDYYIIDDLSLVASKVLKINPDQNPLHDPDGNKFTDELINYFEAQQNNDIFNNKVFSFETFDQIKTRLTYLGYESQFFLALEASMKRGALKHEECSYEIFGLQRVKYNHHFSEDNNGQWTMDKITGTLYYKIGIDYATINGVKTKELDDRMASLNWEIDGHKFLNQNEEKFRLLCDDPIGQVIAVQIFNNNVDPLWADKPDFLIRLEDDLKIYPKMEFPADARAQDIYETLNNYKKIVYSIEQYDIPGVENPATKANMIVKLVKGEPCVFNADVDAFGNKNIEIHWNPRSLTPLFTVQGEDGEDFGKLFQKKTSPQYESRLKELQEYPFRQLGTAATERKLVVELLEGFRKSVHLEKVFVPADEIDKYIIIEPNYPDGKGKYFEPLEIYSTSDLDRALQQMKDTGIHYNHDDSKANTSLMLIGQYIGKELEYDRGDMPTVNTGYLIATISEFSPYGNTLKMQGHVTLNTVLTQQIFVERYDEARMLVFSDKYGDRIEIDKEFWTLKGQHGLYKKQPAEDKALLIKCRTNHDKGRAI